VVAFVLSPLIQSDILARMTIHAICFDIGGVLVRTVDRMPRQALAERLGMTAQKLETLVFGGDIGTCAQFGLVDEAQLWEHACQRVGWPSEQAKELRQQFFGGDRLDTDLLAYIRTLRLSYKTGLISNATSGTRTLIEGVWGMADAFDAIVLSGDVGVMKPEARIYLIALQRLGVKPSQAVFVDDFLQNIEGARAVGMQGIHFRNPEQVRTDLDVLLDGG
jgi:epoxide hydrolase-like predicted phosphatase